jgi:asparagine synthase (glutamine-hydrolysing)
MCGIVGLVGGGPPAQMQKRQNELQRMNETLHHRGPDDAGLWLEPEIDVALAQRRLAIIDVSPLGHQPMVSPSGRWALTCNGEIYNFRELRAELEAKGHSFRGACDIEVLLIAIEQWGVPEALSRASGMFAFAAWDRAQREIWIARDRLGEKPLSYALQNGRFLFASELRAIAAADTFDASLDRGNISGFLRFNYYPGTTSPLHDVRKLAPGHYARLPIRALADRAINRVEQIESRPYWDAPQRFREARKSEITGSLEHAADDL